MLNNESYFPDESHYHSATMNRQSWSYDDTNGSTKLSFNSVSGCDNGSDDASLLALQAFAISDVNCFSRDNDDSLIFLEPMQRENDPEASANKDRLAGKKRIVVVVTVIRLLSRKEFA